MSSSCDLCREAIDGGEAERFAGLDICEHCARADLRGKLAQRRGFSIEETRRPGGGDGSDPTTQVVVVGSIPLAFPLHGVFGREDFVDKVVKLFKKELQIGDPLFDDAISIGSETPEQLGRLLASVGLQAAVLEAVSELGKLVIRTGEGGECRVKIEKGYSSRASDAAGSEARHHLIVAAILHHLERAAAEHGGIGHAPE